MAWGLERSRLHAAWSNLELSTRLVIEEADRRGWNVRLLDAADNFIVLEREGRREYINLETAVAVLVRPLEP